MTWTRGLAIVLGLSSTLASATSFTQGPQVWVSRRQVTVSWKTDVSSSTELSWGPTSAASAAAYPNHSTFGQLAGSLHSRTVKGLAAGTYFFRVRSDDGSVPAESAEFTFVVPLSATFPLGSVVVTGAVTAIAPLGGALYFGGTFSSVGPATGNGLTVTASSGGVVDPDYPEISGVVRCATPDGAGGLYIGGDFTRVGGLTRHHAAHLLPDRGVDPDWDPDLDNAVNAIAVDGNTVYLGGNFGTANLNIARDNFAAVNNSNGQLTSWSANTNGEVRALAVSGGVVYLGGSFTTVGAATRRRAAAVDGATGLVTPWDPTSTARSTR